MIKPLRTPFALIKRPAVKKGGRWGGLTLKILAVNVVAPLVLVLGFLYMGQYRDSLIQAELETLKAQSQLFAGAIAEGAIKPVEREIGRAHV